MNRQADTPAHGAHEMICALILAAGESKRMGEQKLLLKWGKSSVLEHVIKVFSSSGVDDIAVITGSHRTEIEKVISDLKKRHPVKAIFNEHYSRGEMLTSIQCGLEALQNGPADAALIGLGDQPQVRERTVRMVCDAFRRTQSPIVVPSFQMRRGHPWLVARELWNDLLEWDPHQTPRDFLNRHQMNLLYVDAEDSSILADLDTPRDYAESRP